MKQPQSIAIRRLLGEIGVPLLLLGALDLGFGGYVARNSDVPLPKLFGPNPITAGKFLALRERAQRTPTIAVLLLGMSQMMRINGQQLEAELSEHARCPFRVFNFAAHYHSLASDLRLVRDLVLPLAKPQAIVYGLTPMALLNEMVSAQRIDARDDALPIFGLYAGSPLARMRGFASMHLNLWKYTDVILDALQIPLGWKEQPRGALGRAAKPTGDTPLLERHIEVRGPRPGERRNQSHFADFDAVLRKSFLFEHLAQFAEFCRQQGVELVLFNSPVHPLFMQLLPNGEQDYELSSV